MTRTHAEASTESTRKQVDAETASSRPAATDRVKRTNATAHDDLARDIADAEALLQNVPTDANRFMRIGMLILLLGFGGFITWAVTAPLDEGVPAPGTAIVQSERKVISHPTGGTVKAIHVHESQRVREDDPLITLDDTKLRSEYINTLQEYAAHLARLARLEAEQRNADQITFPETLLQMRARNEGNAEAQIQLQRTLFDTRRKALQGELDILRQQAAAAEKTMRTKQTQLKLIERQIASIRQLVREGYAPRNQLLDLEQKAQALRVDIQQARSAAENARLKLEQRRRDFLKDVETERAEVHKTVNMLAARLHALKKELDHMVLRSPVDGLVNNLRVHTIGGVIRPAEPIMEIIPEGEQIIFRVQISPQYIDRIRAGQPADIQLGAYLNKPQLIIEGRVLSVSPDLIEPGDGRTPPYYEAKVALTEKGLATLKQLDAAIQPGMPATILIKTGERTLLDYLLQPLLKRLHTAMKEA